MSTTHKVQVNVGCLADMGKRFVGARKQAESDEPVDQTHITFVHVQTMFKTQSPHRLDLIKFELRTTFMPVPSLALGPHRQQKHRVNRRHIAVQR